MFLYSHIFFIKLLRLFGCLIKLLTYFKGKLIKDNSMSRNKLAMVRLGLSKFESQHDLHCRFFHYQRNFFNTTEIRRSWHVDKLLKCKLLYNNGTNGDLKLESQIFANSRVTLAKYNIPIMLMGLPKSCKRYGNGVSIVTVKVRFYTTTLIGGEGEGKQSISCESLNRSNIRDLNKHNTINIYNILLDPDFIWEAYWKRIKNRGLILWALITKLWIGFRILMLATLFKSLKIILLRLNQLNVFT